MNQSKLNILFFYVHPAKFHLFKNTISLLEKNGHNVDIAISNKEVLSELLESANVRYTNLFPNGRKLSFLPKKVNALLGLIRTLWKLWLLSKNNRYNIYVTDDVLSILGRIQGVPSISFTDNDLTTIPLIKLIFKSSTKIIAPQATNLNDLEYKKIAFKGNKAVAHLTPKYFKKDSEILKKYNLQNKDVVVIRLAKLNANHDFRGNTGITDSDLKILVKSIPKNKTIVISSERFIPMDYSQFKHNISPQDFTQILAAASFFIGDSGTMANEAAILGVPNILINKLAKECGVHVELRANYNLQYYFDTFSECLETLKKLMNNGSYQSQFQKKRDKFIQDSDDFNTILFDAIIKLAKPNANNLS